MVIVATVIEVPPLARYVSRTTAVPLSDAHCLSVLIKPHLSFEL